MEDIGDYDYEQRAPKPEPKKKLALRGTQIGKYLEGDCESVIALILNLTVKMLIYKALKNMLEVKKQLFSSGWTEER